MKVSDFDVKTFTSAFEQELCALLEKGDDVISEGMRYATLEGGKRIRPVCVFLGARAIDEQCDVDKVMRLALGIELIHSYSLVHDDLPAMDNDDYRRGKLSVHKKFGHANGILIGDQLLSTAMSVLLEGSSVYGTNFARAAEMLASSAKEMVLGQMRDLNGCQSVGEYFEMYSQKTSALIKGAFSAGAIVAGASLEQIEKIGDYAQNVGIAFQLADDLLDGDKHSIIAALGVDGVKNALEEKTLSACSLANEFKNASELANFATMLGSRKK